MEMALLGALGCVATLLLILLWIVLSGRRRMQQALAASCVDVERLRARLEAMSQEIEAARVIAAATPVVPQTEYLITSDWAATALEDEAAMLSNRTVLSVALGEPLVKVVAFAYGVRRALSPETRNRIAFEMRREVKRARKARKRDTRRAAREAASQPDRQPDRREAAA
jgi:hypothetical protein